MNLKRVGYCSRWIVCFAGIALMALGVSLTTRANLGTTAISAIPYVASLGFAPSIGFFTGALNVLLVIMQIVIMRGRFPRLQYLQIPVSCLFGLLIDFWMHMLPDAAPQSYLSSMLLLAAGIVALAVGVFVEVSADVVMMAGEGAVKTFSLVLKKDFGILKTGFDVTMVLLGVALSLILFRELRGIGEGTILSAVLVGFILKGFHSIKTRLSRTPVAVSESASQSSRR